MLRKYDVVVWGATGFTGQLVAEHFARCAPPTVRWAIGGRSRERLDKVMRACEDLRPVEKGALRDVVDILEGDGLNQSDMDRIAGSTRVVLSTAGPFAQFGTALVDACVRSCTHYCDITGEIFWVKQMIEKYHEQASKNQILIVPCCGFDSMPSDLSNFIVSREFAKRNGTGPEQVTSVILAAKGGISGGTIQSALGSLNAGPYKRTMIHPYGLNPPDDQVGPDKNIRLPTFNKVLSTWTHPWLLGAVNERNVRRSISLAQVKPKYRFNEVQAGSLWRSIGSTCNSLQFPPINYRTQFVVSFGPAPGQGPSRETMRRGRLNMKTIAERTGTKPVICEVHIPMDPGYSGTAVMVSEAALCLALCDRNKLHQGGVLTPAIAMGTELVNRLQAHGFTYTIVDN